MTSLKTILGGFLIWLGCVTSAAAIGLLRDSDVEYALAELARPILTEAGVSPSSIKILVVDDPKINAFVIDTQYIFVNSGLILKSKTPEMLQAVIAHEAAHIANGHITRRLQNFRDAHTAAGFGTALALMVGAASGRGDLGYGLAVGAQSASQRALLAHTRAEEAAADSASFNYLRRAGIDPKGMLDTLNLLRGQLNVSEHHQDPYTRSHPLTRDRLRNVEVLIASDTQSYAPTSATYWFHRAKGKIEAFERDPNWVVRSAKSAPTADLQHSKAAVGLMRMGKLDKALGEIKAARNLRPNDPFLTDLHGEILMRNRAFKAAVGLYAKAAAQAPKDGLIQANYGRALLADGQSARAVKQLEKARHLDKRNPRMLQDLSVAYAKVGKTGNASEAAAARYALIGKLDTAKTHAKRASDLLPRGTPAWQRAQDILFAK